MNKKMGGRLEQEVRRILDDCFFNCDICGVDIYIPQGSNKVVCWKCGTSYSKNKQVDLPNKSLPFNTCPLDHSFCLKKLDCEHCSKVKRKE